MLLATYILLSCFMVVIAESCFAMAAESPDKAVFTNYPVNVTFRGKPKPVDFKSHPMARMFRTQLLAAAATGKPTFAGFYIVAHWGCGTMCEQVALIDVRTGKVYFPQFATSVGNQHRINSRLFIADPPQDIAIYNAGKSPGDPPLHTSYWLWIEKTKQFILSRAELTSVKRR